MVLAAHTLHQFRDLSQGEEPPTNCGSTWTRRPRRRAMSKVSAVSILSGFAQRLDTSLTDYNLGLCLSFALLDISTAQNSKCPIHTQTARIASRSGECLLTRANQATSKGSEKEAFQIAADAGAIPARDSKFKWGIRNTECGLTEHQCARRGSRLFIGLR